ncbi:hypothetical protein [Alistipes communis]|uniref:hypothetical protein n=1 Tax=Alistipes communis TaxID=2585118 RepID=UPI00035DAC92|nr:hypothetical protein [Alistipes communis]
MERVDELELIVAGTHSHYMAMKKFEELDAILMTAKYCLGEGSRFDRKAYSECNGVRTYDKKAQYHLNLHDLKSAVVWYNSSIDYLLQIIYFGFEFYTPFHTNAKYREELRKCVWNEKYTFYKDFCTLADVNDNAKNLKIKWQNLQQHDSVKHIRKFANAIKHHGGFELTETADRPMRIGVTEPFSSKTVDWDEIMRRPTIPFIELVQNLIVVHNEVITLEEYLFDELGLSDVPSTIRVGIDKITQSFSARDLLNAKQ